MASPAETFVQLSGKLDYPMLVVTVTAAGEQAGCLVGFSTQCSIDPARFMVCLSDKNRTFRLAQDADALAVHFLPVTAIDLARLFGSETDDELDKFDRCRWRRGPGGLPILEGCERWFTGEILARWPLGDHWGYLLAPFAAHDDDADSFLPFSQVKGLPPGHGA
jgi:flavin reductase (DIM6/NTAB) family NADH-FMN oxidoreductase RutF